MLCSSQSRLTLPVNHFQRHTIFHYGLTGLSCRGLSEFSMCLLPVEHCCLHAALTRDTSSSFLVADHFTYMKSTPGSKGDRQWGCPALKAAWNSCSIITADVNAFNFSSHSSDHTILILPPKGELKYQEKLFFSCYFLFHTKEADKIIQSQSQLCVRIQRTNWMPKKLKLLERKFCTYIFHILLLESE